MATDLDDPIAAAATSDNPYLRATVERTRPIRGPVSRTLRRQAGLLAALALAFPILATYPAQATHLLPASLDETFPKVLLVGALGGVGQLLGAAVLVGLVYTRSTVSSDRQAHRLVALEDLATTLSLTTGVIAISFTIGFLSLGHVEDATVVTSGTTDPFATVRAAVGAGIAVDTVALVAVVGALACYAASRWVTAREHRLRR
jgi:hypothetical protein